MHNRPPQPPERPHSARPIGMLTIDVRSFVISMLLIALLTLAGTYLLVDLWRTLNEDEEVLFFFFGVPAFLGTSFIVITALYYRLSSRSFPWSSLLTGGLLATVVSIPALWSIGYLTSFSSMTGDVVRWVILISAWISTMFISAVLFIAVLRHR